ncbi:hypothetical protein C8C83_2260 [Flavobacterium sp. 90]|uniref:hypothetical protein n=1 Tax=unclassified Flavobacterium TaxID=196869 RepID=UPI000EACA2B3|nr:MULTISPECIES: hypothetical protein [unclassified Flavobacterium]RKR10584.1 hypothetical protein C8C82_2565 [Flavobacterium sp. 81]TCK54367.1 hypothetical protein C8C83_2260 [Flavobacterium sp. 90]
MDNEKLKILRNTISIPLNVAVELLRKNNGDIALCEREFHNDNIQTISIKAECGYDIAKENYELCNYDVIKAVERINQKPITITTGKTTDSKIGFILWPENGEGEFYKTVKRNDVFIPTEDFDLILKEFQSVFPLRNPWNDIIEDEFDNTGNNFFDHKTIRLIVEKIKLIKNENEKEKAFLMETINWLNDKLVYAEYIVVYGNL